MTSRNALNFNPEPARVLPTFHPEMKTAASNIRTTLEMIKIEHTLFALPFAFLGALLAARGFTPTGLPTVWQLVWITLAMVGARSAAMAFNRIADREFDARNPRTAARAIPAGMLSVSLVVLGWCLSIAPTGAWVAVRGAIDSPVPLLLSAVVLLWTAGFDVLYACQDYDFDRAAGLRSVPARLGVARSLWVSRGLHAGAFAALVGLYFLTGLGAPAVAGVAATGALLVYQHSLVRAEDLSRLNAAFFTTNAFVSVILLATFGGAALL